MELKRRRKFSAAKPGQARHCKKSPELKKGPLSAGQTGDILTQSTEARSPMLFGLGHI